MGDTDNHGRNTALQKHPDWRIALAPLFDFAPMTFDPGVIAPSTTWVCLRGKGGALDYRLIAEAAGEATGDADIPNRLLAALSARADTVERLPDIARRQGVSETVIERACRFAEETAQAMPAGGAP